jgi:DNA modification methylase
MHPTIKPVAMVAESIRDCSKRCEVILDGFGGSGSTLMAAEKTGRSTRLIEYHRRYCDTTVRRWEFYTGQRGMLGGRSYSFEAVAENRLGLQLGMEAA